MKSHLCLRLGLTLALLATGIVADAQTRWPTTKVARAAAASKPVQIRKPRAARKRGTTKVVARASTKEDLLRSMAELVTRQAAAIEALARRLEAAETRLELLSAAATTNAPMASVIDEAQAPFRASLSIDWAQVSAR